MFTYFYRILDKYNKPVTAITIFTDNNKKFKPGKYEYECLSTKNIFYFNTYKIIEQEEAALQKSSNPFVSTYVEIVLTVLLALKSKKQTDEYLLGLKLRIARDLLDRNISPDKVRALMTFLKLYVNFADPETNAKFINEISLITENRKTMGIEEMVLERAKKEGLEKGKETKSYEVVRNLIEKMGMTDAQAADIAGVSVDFVKKVRRKLKK